MKSNSKTGWWMVDHTQPTSEKLVWQLDFEGVKAVVEGKDEEESQLIMPD